MIQLIQWKPVSRKRRVNISYTDPDYVRGYDLDNEDFGKLITRFKDGPLPRNEENRLLDHVLTMISIVSANPKLRIPSQDFQEATDYVFLKAWGALTNVKDGTNPYSYMYRTIYTKFLSYFDSKYRRKRNEELLQEYIDETYREYLDEIDGGRVDCFAEKPIET